MAQGITPSELRELADEALADLAVATAGQAGAGRLLGLAHATPSFGATERPSSRSRMIV